MNTIRLLLVLLFCSIINVAGYAQSADAILGKWINPSGEGQIQVYKKGNLFYGKLAWLKSPDDEKTGQLLKPITMPLKRFR